MNLSSYRMVMHKKFHEGIQLLPLLTAMVTPLTILFDIPATSQAWYESEKLPVRRSHISLILSALSLAASVTGNVVLLARFLTRRRLWYLWLTIGCILSFTLRTVLGIVNLCITSSSDFLPSSGYFCAIAGCCLGSLSTMTLSAHHAFTHHAITDFEHNDLYLNGRSILMSETALIILIGIQGLVFSRLEGWAYFDGIYFSVTTALTIGFGDLVPTTKLGKILSFPFVVLAITQLGSIVAELWKAFSMQHEISKRATRSRSEHTRWHLETESGEKHVDLVQETQLLEQVEAHIRRETQHIAFGLSIGLFLIIWLIGALIFARIEDWKYYNALYFSYVTFLTIGYGDYVPRSPGARVIFVLYALLAVPIITFFVLQSVKRAQEVLWTRLSRQFRPYTSEHNALQPHHELLTQARANLIRANEENPSVTAWNHKIIEIVLRMDSAIRKLLVASLKDRARLIIKADTFLQYRNADPLNENVLEEFVSIDAEETLATYRLEFAQFLFAASRSQGLHGEARRLFLRRSPYVMQD